MSGSESRAQLVLCGLGGQGVVFLSRVLAQAAMLEGREVLTAETHGMAQRGGAVESSIKLGGFRSSIVRPGCADAALVLDETRLDAGRRYVSEQGVCFVNSARPADGARSCDATAVAERLESPRGANLVLLGFAAECLPGVLPGEAHLIESIQRLSPPAVREGNLLALEQGATAARTAGGIHG